jgi:hypothetical protein
MTMMIHYFSCTILTVVVVLFIAADTANARLTAMSKEGQEKIFNHVKFSHPNTAMGSINDLDVIENEYIIELQDNVTDVDATVRAIVGVTGTIKFVYQHIMKGAAIKTSPLMTSNRMINILDNTIVKSVSSVRYD